MKIQVSKAIIAIVIVIIAVLSVVYNNEIRSKTSPQKISETNTTGGVSDVLNDKIGQEQEVIEELEEYVNLTTSDEISTIEVDVDLTGLSQNIALTEFTTISYFPNEYEGQTIKIQAIYYSEYIEEFEEDVHCVLMVDDTNCCQALLEIKMVDEDFAYPPINSSVLVVGKISTYPYMEQTFYRLDVTDMIVNEK